MIGSHDYDYRVTLVYEFPLTLSFWIGAELANGAKIAQQKESERARE